jgi:hypothetical protein
MVTKRKRPSLEAKVRKKRQEMNNELVLEGIRPNKKQNAIAKSEYKSGEMDIRLVV